MFVFPPQGSTGSSYLLVCFLSAHQGLDPQDGRADGEAELQGREDDQQPIDAPQKHLSGVEKTAVNFKTHSNTLGLTCFLRYMFLYF